MKAIVFIAIAVVATIAAAGQGGSGGFNPTGNMNAARENHTATLLSNGEVLVTGGDNNTDGYLASAELYSPATGRWTLTNNMTEPRSGHEAVRLPNGQVLVAGGLNATTYGQAPLASAELYNPATGTWTKTGSMITGRESFALILLANGEVLAAGGFSNGPISNAELYNPATGAWTSTGSMNGGVNNDAAVLLPNGEVFASNDLYNPTTGTWTKTSSPPVCGCAPIALLQNGDVWTAGNVQGESFYDPSTNQWTTFSSPPCTQLHQNCEAAAATLGSGKVLVAGGVTYVNARPYPIAETNGLAALFDPSTLTWASTGNLKKDRIGETMTVLLNGQALVAGGETFDKGVGHLVPINSAELYTP